MNILVMGATGFLGGAAAARQLARAGQRWPTLLTVLRRPEGLSLGARVLFPLADVVVLTLLPYPLLQTPFSLATTANGQVMAFQRQAYWSLGGHANVRGDMLEDTQFARNLRAAGKRVT